MMLYIDSIHYISETYMWNLINNMLIIGVEYGNKYEKRLSASQFRLEY